MSMISQQIEKLRFASEWLKNDGHFDFARAVDGAIDTIKTLSAKVSEKNVIVRCKECIYYDPPHVEDDGVRIEYKDLPKEAFDIFGTGLVNISYGVNVGGRCTVDYNAGYADDKRVYRSDDNYCSKGRRKDG